ncbi:iron permease FTR1 family protein [Microdochium trichocladiopsis]|uniref:Iron permease FTR1 family protein n=1 Tax=Microdochium trichocladiopsis TaxID=1682393 RepID=A0A9P8XXK9_9PEZI|nr:iron permease FTR1 family protein [Microdochium trichocladiopsis]KAH7025109.1 iron permease FTR1 family protein [Microdochium trichocladiopsis]
MAVDVFSVPVFLIVFRETLETVIIVSVLLAFLKLSLDGSDGSHKTYKKLTRQVWLGTALGLLICLIVAGAVIGVFYRVGVDAWSGSEGYYEGAFCLVASVIITIMGAALLRIGKMQQKWRARLAAALDSPLRSSSRRAKSAGGGGGSEDVDDVAGGDAAAAAAVGKLSAWDKFKLLCEKYAMFFLPLITVLREGIEAVVFIAGVTFSAPATSVPLPVVIGLIAGCVVGYALYKGGSTTSLKFFLIASCCLLYLVAAGLFSRAVWLIESQKWNEVVGGDAAEVGDGPGSYDIDKSVWHVNCCSPDLNGGGGWGVFNAILGWQNSATYGSVISYNVYWIFVMAGFGWMRYTEKRKTAVKEQL